MLLSYLTKDSLNFVQPQFSLRSFFHYDVPWFLIFLLLPQWHICTGWTEGLVELILHPPVFIFSTCTGCTEELVKLIFQPPVFNFFTSSTDQFAMV